MKDDHVWEEKHSSDTLTRKKNNCLDLQPKEQGVAKTTSGSTELISVLFYCTCWRFLLMNVAAHYGVEDIISLLSGHKEEMELIDFETGEFF